MNQRSSLRSYAAPSAALETVQLKLSRIVSRNEQLKVAFHQLHSQIRAGLREAEDVLASLAIPLMKLVGLKTVEMAADGRFSTVVTSIDCSHSQAVLESQENNYMTRAMAASNDLMERQRQRLTELITLLKKIETQVNSSQNSIFQNLADHQDFMKKFFIKAFTHVSAIHHSGHSDDLFRVMLKILKVIFDQVGVALRSVEVGIDDLMCELAGNMCHPMVEYANSLKVEIKSGICSRLLEVVQEMDEAIKAGKFELEEARKRERLAEQRQSEALSKLQKLEETATKLTKSLGYLIEDAPKSEEKLTQEKCLGTKEDLAKDDNILWDMLRTKRKCQTPDSPLETKHPLGVETSHKKVKMARGIPSLSHKALMTSPSKVSNRPSSSINSKRLLGSFPSASTQKVLYHKRITP